MILPSSTDRLADNSSNIAAKMSNPDRFRMCAANEAITLPKIPPNVPPNPTKPRRFNRRLDFDGLVVVIGGDRGGLCLVVVDIKFILIPSLSFATASRLCSAFSSYSIASVVTPHINDNECNFIRWTTKKNIIYITLPNFFNTFAYARKKSDGIDSLEQVSSITNAFIRRSNPGNCSKVCFIRETDTPIPMNVRRKNATIDAMADSSITFCA